MPLRILTYSKSISQKESQRVSYENGVRIQFISHNIVRSCHSRDHGYVLLVYRKLVLYHPSLQNLVQSCAWMLFMAVITALVLCTPGPEIHMSALVDAAVFISLTRQPLESCTCLPNDGIKRATITATAWRFYPLDIEVKWIKVLKFRVAYYDDYRWLLTSHFL